MFKSKRKINESMYKLDIYLNDLFDSEIISCCEYGLIRNDTTDLFQIKEVIGSQPCEK